MPGSISSQISCNCNILHSFSRTQIYINITSTSTGTEISVQSVQTMGHRCINLHLPRYLDMQGCGPHHYNCSLKQQIQLNCYLAVYFPRIFEYIHLYQVLIVRAKILWHASARASQFQHDCNHDLEIFLVILPNAVSQPETSNYKGDEQITLSSVAQHK